MQRLLSSLRAPGLAYRDFTSAPRPAVRVRPRDGMLLVALVSLQRGAGRTTLAAGLARTLGRQGRRAVALELDARGDLSSWFDVKRARDAELIDLGGLDGEAIWVNEHTGFVPYGHDAAHALDVLADECDVVLIDTPALPGPLLERALAEADEVVVVLRPAHATVGAVRALEEFAARTRHGEWRRTRPRYLLNGFDACRDVDRAAVRRLRALVRDRLLPVQVHEDAAVQLAREQGRAVHDVAPASQAAADLDELARLLVPRNPKDRP